MELRCNSFLELTHLARCIARVLKPGDKVLLAGDLGAGKTTLVSEICKVWGYQDASSPTFTLIQNYSSQPVVYHLDLYRLESEHEVRLLDLENVLEDDSSVVFIEWADRLGSLTPEHFLTISISIFEGEARTFSFEGKGERFIQLVDKIATDFKAV